MKKMLCLFVTLTVLVFGVVANAVTTCTAVKNRWGSVNVGSCNPALKASVVSEIGVQLSEVSAAMSWSPFGFVRDGMTDKGWHWNGTCSKRGTSCVGVSSVSGCCGWSLRIYYR
ncbi:MAG: hypothetical protein KAS93_01060 [Gammaproteobacteria bacterium]|nr:hypothetical protein [Gammaproteobacteria bacterium]